MTLGYAAFPVERQVQTVSQGNQAEVQITEKEDASENKQVVSSPAATSSASGKSQLIALVLCALVGFVGVHRFYLGYITQGVLQILTFGGCGIWTLIDLIRIVTGDLKPKGGDYAEKL